MKDELHFALRYFGGGCRSEDGPQDAERANTLKILDSVHSTFISQFLLRSETFPLLKLLRTSILSHSEEHFIHDKHLSF